MKQISVSGMWDNAEQVLTYIQIRDRERERGEGRPSEVVDEFPSLFSLPDPVFLGSFAWSKASNDYRWVKRNFALQDGDVVMTPGDIARSYLKIRFPKWRGRVTTEQYQAIIRERQSQPLLAKIGEYDDMVYVDMKSAYWSILKIVGWNVDYFPHQFIGAGEDIYDFPFPENKLARNCLVTACLPSPSQLWNGSNILSLNSKKPMVNLVLWACIMDVLHGVAADMLRLGAVYINTDGYIIPKRNERIAHELFEAWGLPMSIKGEGYAKVLGAGDYDMPHHQSRLRRIKSIPHFHVDMTKAKWLRPRIKKLAEIRLRHHPPKPQVMID